MPLETPAAVKELPPQKSVRDSIFKGMQLAATTEMPVAKRVALNCRWRVNFAEDQMPVLRINKIGIHRVDDKVKDDDEEKRKKNEGRSGEMDVLKSMCFWMKREVDVLTQTNREMKNELEEMRRRSSSGGSGSGNFREGARKKPMPMPMASVESPMKQWKSGRDSGAGGGKENEIGKREEKKNGNVVAIDVENELQRAIMAAAAAASPSP